MCGHDSPTFLVFLSISYTAKDRLPTASQSYITIPTRRLLHRSVYPVASLSFFLSFFLFGRWAYHRFHRPQSLSDGSVLHKDFVLSHPLIATIRANQPPGYFPLIYPLYFFLVLVLIYLPSPPLLKAVEPSAFRLTAGSLEVVGYWVAPVFLFCLAWTILLPDWTLRKGLYGVPGLCKFIIDATDLSRH